ncbi:MAG: 50S ribosomal protein L21 [bacterium]|nr:50S ribosomal protein L21 [bacterium]
MTERQSNDRGSNGVDFAIIETGGKQYRVKKGDTIRVEKLEGKDGDAVTFDKVLLSVGRDMELGAPFLAGATVTGKILSSGRGKKIEVLKYKAKSRYRKLRGHRQPYTIVAIESLK